MGALVLNSFGRPHCRCNVDERKMSNSPILWRKSGSLQSETQRNASCGGILASSKPRPHAQVIDEVQQFILLTVANDGPKHLLHEAPSNAVSALLELDLVATLIRLRSI